MKQRFSTIFLLLLLLLAGSRVVTQSVPKPFDIRQPLLRVFLPASELATGRAVIVCPGGGYSHLASEYKGCDWTPYFNKQSTALIVLKYRMPRGDRTLPTSDVEVAMRVVRDSVGVWNLNPNDIGTVNSSAGGYLASTVAAHAKPELRPNSQTLFYPVITMNESYIHMESHDNPSRKNASAELEAEYLNEKQVTKDTPCVFIIYGDNDKTIPPANGVNYYLTLNKDNIPSVLHIRPSGEYEQGIREGFLYKSRMLNELTSWLRSFRVPHRGAVRVACIDNSIMYGAHTKNRDRDSYPAVLSRILGETYRVKNFEVSTCTLSNKDDSPYMNEKVYQDALALNPSIVVVKLGANDSRSFNWRHKADFMKDLQTMTDAFKALPSRPEIYLYYPPKAYQTEDNINDDIVSEETILMIKKVVKRSNLSVIDFYTAMDGMPELFPSKIHSGEESVKVVAKAVYQSLKK